MGTLDLNVLRSYYAVEDIVLEPTDSDQHLLELDCIADLGVRVFTGCVYQQPHYRLHKKFLYCLYNNITASAVFFGRILMSEAPPEMRQYYINMIERLTNKENDMGAWDATSHEEWAAQQEAAKAAEEAAAAESTPPADPA